MKKTFVEIDKKTGNVLCLRFYDSGAIPAQACAIDREILEIDGIHKDIEELVEKHGLEKIKMSGLVTGIIDGGDINGSV